MVAGKLKPYISIVLAVIAGSTSLVGFGIFLFSGPLGWMRLGFGTGGILLFDATLSCLFFLQHSGMIRSSFRKRLDWAEYHGIIYTIASSIPLILLLIFWQEAELLFISLQGVPRAMSRVLFLLACFGILWSVRALGSFDSFGIQPLLSRLNDSKAPETPFVARGPYRWVRHPIYSFVLLMIWSHPDVTADRLLFNILWTIWIITGTSLEERDLIAEFGRGYLDYQKAVPMLLPNKIPPKAN